jgi:hypothetical protein
MCYFYNLWWPLNTGENIRHKTDVWRSSRNLLCFPAAKQLTVLHILNYHFLIIVHYFDSIQNSSWIANIILIILCQLRTSLVILKVAILPGSGACSLFVTNFRLVVEDIWRSKKSLSEAIPTAEYRPEPEADYSYSANVEVYNACSFTPQHPLSACSAIMTTLPLDIQKLMKSLYKTREGLILDPKWGAGERECIDRGKTNGLKITGKMVSLKELMFAINGVVHVGNTYVRLHTGLPGCLNSCCNRFYRY